MKEDENSKSASSSIRPNSKASAITQHQLAKFQELQRRRLQVKDKTKNKRKSKDKGVNILSKNIGTQGCVDDHTDESLNDSGFKHGSNGSDSNEDPCVDTHPALRKRKLHWGLDTKERWERKANM